MVRPERGSNRSTAEASLPKEKNRAVCPKHQIVREKRAAPLREIGRSEQEHGEERVDSTVKKGGFKEER